ncbi:hypothetical protein AB0D84_33980 [Streptomyces sp. NPDC048193]|uniref:hypothetical protein n=1 Tax=unclassified Streptomyces TaxID=2593676 RepID=UPI00341814D4
MTSDRSASPHGARLSRVIALTAGATLGLGALCAAPLAMAGTGGTEATDTVASAADTASPAVTLGTTTVKPGGEVPVTVTGFPAGGTLSVKLDDTTLLRQFPIGDDGSVSGSVTVPAAANAGGAHWLRFLAPDPATSLKVEFAVTDAAAGDTDAASAASSTTAPDPVTKTMAAASAEAPVSYATIAWSATAAAAGGAAGAAATTMFAVRRRTTAAGSAASS